MLISGICLFENCRQAGDVLSYYRLLPPMLYVQTMFVPTSELLYNRDIGEKGDRLCGRLFYCFWGISFCITPYIFFIIYKRLQMC